MLFRQYHLGCLSLLSYLIGDETTGRAVVVDPQRDVSQYLADAAEHGLHIERVIETHFHADFLSGHLELAAATGARITYGAGAEAEFDIDVAEDGDRFSLGAVTIEVRATPGHTPESISLVVYDAPGAPPWGVLTGDTLFIGDVGRPDLLAAAGASPDELARLLYRSLHTKLLTLPDDTFVYPAHGAGSACGRNMSAATSSTIGEQRATNHALQPMSEDAFVDAVTAGQSVAPLYFGYAAAANHRAHSLLDDHEAPALLDVAALERAIADGVTVIDSRAGDAFASAHVRGSINVGLDGRFAEYAGDVVLPSDRIVVVADRGRETEARVRLARIGFDRVEGAMVDVEHALLERPALSCASTRITAADLAAWRDDEPGLQLVDVRNPSEQEGGMVEGALSMPLATLLARLHELDAERTVVVYCAGGYRSAIAASLLRSRGFARVADVIGGYGALVTTPAPL